MTRTTTFTKPELLELIRGGYSEGLKNAAHSIRREVFGDSVYLRGLIEFTNHCRNDCYYCGLRRGNRELNRYRLTVDEILACAETGHRLGFRTFVLQGGEDSWFTVSRMVGIIESLKNRYPECAVTLSIGERPMADYLAFRQAGADRFLLRHETADTGHYARLHPKELTLENRKRCLYNLREAGFQVGAGFMVGSPFQTEETLAEDILFLQDLQPHMVGIGPFVPQAQTPFHDRPAGSLEQTLAMVAITRLALPKALLPATTALGAIHPKGREMALLSGANVVMPNLSPLENRKLYSLYDNKPYTGDEAAEGLAKLSTAIKGVGLMPDMRRGDHPDKTC